MKKKQKKTNNNMTNELIIKKYKVINKSNVSEERNYYLLRKIFKRIHIDIDKYILHTLFITNNYSLIFQNKNKNKNWNYYHFIII